MTFAAVTAVLVCTLLYHAITIWNPVRSDHSDVGDWVNGTCAVLVLAALISLVSSTAATPMTRWAPLATALWVGTVATTLILAGSALTVAGLSGPDEARQLRVIAVACAVAALVQPVVALWGGERAVVAGVQAAAVVMIAGCAWTSRRPPQGGTRMGVTSQSATIGALVVAFAGALTLAAVAVVHHAPVVSVLMTSIAVLGSGFRLLHLIGSLEHLSATRREARTDDLTGVGNRRALSVQLHTWTRSSAPQALLVIDLDKFKEINDRFGHAVGDEVLVEVARRISDLAPPTAVLARQGGDEFAILLRPASLASALELAGKVSDACVDPVRTSAGQRVLNVSVGVASSTDGTTPEELMRRADAAMYTAKKAGGGVQAYDLVTDQKTRVERARVDELRAVLEGGARADDQIEVFFQPLHDAASDRVVGAEALVRWRHPTLGVLPPGEFLDLVELHGMMTALTMTVLGQALSAVASWRGAGIDIHVSVNLSASCLTNPDLPVAVQSALSDAGVPADALVLEVTETTLMHDPRRARHAMAVLTEMGVGLSIDDYGTGYSSLAYLSDLPARELKVDRSFTSRLTTDPKTGAIVASTIDLAHALSMRVVAEGVEDESTLSMLRTLGCDETQGYFHARPMPADSFRTYLGETAGRSAAPAAAVGIPSLGLDGEQVPDTA